MSELIINTKDAYTYYGVRMGEGFLDEIDNASPLKEFIENKSRLEHGKTVIHNSPKLDERDITLTFNIHGISQSDFSSKLSAFKAELYKGLVIINVPVLNETFRLTYKSSLPFAMNKNRTFAKISVKFNEPNPSLRT